MFSPKKFISNLFRSEKDRITIDGTAYQKVTIQIVEPKNYEEERQLDNLRFAVDDLEKQSAVLNDKMTAQNNYIKFLIQQRKVNGKNVQNQKIKYQKLLSEKELLRVQLMDKSAELKEMKLKLKSANDEIAKLEKEAAQADSKNTIGNILKESVSEMTKNTEKRDVVLNDKNEQLRKSRSLLDNAHQKIARYGGISDDLEEAKKLLLRKMKQLEEAQKTIKEYELIPKTTERIRFEEAIITASRLSEKVTLLNKHLKSKDITIKNAENDLERRNELIAQLIEKIEELEKK